MKLPKPSKLSAASVFAAVTFFLGYGLGLALRGEPEPEIREQVRYIEQPGDTDAVCQSWYELQELLYYGDDLSPQDNADTDGVLFELSWRTKGTDLENAGFTLGNAWARKAVTSDSGIPSDVYESLEIIDDYCKEAIRQTGTSPR